MQVLNNTQISVTTFSILGIGDCFRYSDGNFYMKVAIKENETANAVNLGNFNMAVFQPTVEVTRVTATLTLTN